MDEDRCIMRDKVLHIRRLLSGMLMLLLLVACSSCSDDDSTQPLQPGEKPVLKLYIFSPDNPIVTRASGDHVESETDAEKKINTLQVWVFKNNTNDLVSYVKLEFNEEQSIFDEKVVLMDLTEDFVVNKTEVDIFVAANVTQDNCGLSFDKNTTATTLQNAKIGSGYFGIGSTSKVTAVPTGGLPMTGRLKMQTLTGTSPVFGIGNQNVKLVRAVSKVRFVFAKTTGQPTVTITGITMNAEMIPDEEYLFKTPASMNYNADVAPLLSMPIADIASTPDPTQYIYFDQEAQAYENLINGANLTVRGPIYLRESDKQLSGTISYKIDGGTEQTADFQMQQAGDFLRNHTWIIYAYYAGSGRLQVQSLYVKDWSGKEMSHNFYNW